MLRSAIAPAALFAVLAFGASCKATLGEGEQNSTDTDDDGDALPVDTAPGVPDADIDAAPDSSPDARACAGGDLAMASTDGVCFAKFNTLLPRGGALTSCAALVPGLSTLAIVDSAAAQLVVGAMVGVTESTWIGASDLVTEGTFLWPDATPLVYDHWNAGEPNNGGTDGEDCAVIAGDRVDEWDDRPCATAYTYICSYRL